jgi:hypothetical protein
MVLFRQAPSVIEIGKIVYSLLRFDHRPLDWNFQRIQTHLLCGRIEKVIGGLRFPISAVDEIPPGNLDGKHGEWPAVHVEDLTPVCLFEMRH